MKGVFNNQGRKSGGYKRLSIFANVNVMKNKAAQQLGRLGGKAGKGTSKVRGDSEYYRNIRKKRKPKSKKI